MAWDVGSKQQMRKKLDGKEDDTTMMCSLNLFN